MTTLVDLLQGAQDALFAALKPTEGDAGLPTGVQVFQHVPEDIKPPMIVIGMITSEQADVKDEQLEEISAEIQFEYRGDGRAPLLAMMHAARCRLDRQEITLPGTGVLLEHPRFIKAATTGGIADGTTYMGIVHFQFFAWPG